MEAEIIESVDLTKDSDTENSEDAKECKLDTNFFTIAAPASFRPNSDYVLALTLHDSDVVLPEPCVVIVSVQDEQDENRYNAAKQIQLAMNVTRFLTIPIADVPLDRNYKLVAYGASGIAFQKEATIKIQTKLVSIMIQTDRAIYKPGDCVRFRVLVLDPRLRPAKIGENGLNVMITDPLRNHVKQWKGVTTVHGVFQSEFQLSDLPNLGNWAILAEIGEESKIKNIEIREYVLPKFEVSIDSAKYFTIKEGKVTVIVNAKYTYGKKLRGKATVSVSGIENFGCVYQTRPRRGKKGSDDEEDEGNPLVKKTIDIDGRAIIEFDIKNELKYDLEVENNKYYSSKEFKISVKVVEDLTGLSQSAKKNIIVQQKDYQITSSLKHFAYKRGGPLNFIIFVRNHDDSPPVLSSKKISILREQFLTVDGDEKSEVSLADYELSSKGELNLTWETLKNESHFTVAAIYDGQKQDLGHYYTEKLHSDTPEGDFIRASILTENPSVNNDIEVEVLTSQPLTNYTYQLVAGGKILKSETFNLPENTTKTHRFKFTATYDLIPKARLLIYLVKKDKLFSAKCEIDIKKELNNFIDVGLNPDTANPGQIVGIDIKTKPKAFVGLLGIDQSVLLLKTGNDLSSDEAFGELESFSKETKKRIFDPNEKAEKIPSHGELWDDFTSCDILLLTNIIPPIREVVCYKMCAMPFASPASFGGYGGFGGFGAALPPKVRKDFPDTWLWESMTGESSDGIINLKKRVPDTITSWIVTGFSIDSVTGLGLTKEPKKLTVFQPFFVSLNLPYSVKRGEVVTVPCTIFNYMDNDVEAELTLENEHNEFDFIDAEKNEVKAAHRTTKVIIKSNDGVTTNFVIKPTHVGVIPLKVKAVSAMAGDAVTRTLNVQPEGVPQFFNKAVFVDLREKSEIEPISLQIDIPKTALPDSTRIEVSCVGDLLGGTIKNLQNLIRLPYGCGEQNMLNFVPNIVILDYLTHTGQLTAEIEEKAKRYMEIGYQRELKYKHKDGSFSAFGESDDNGSTWLTAFVARSFQRASEHIFIDEKIVANALSYLKSVQNTDGSFAEKGSVCHKEMQGGSSKGVALTAYVLTAFLQNKETLKAYEETCNAAIKNLIDSLKDVNDVYALSVTAYALQLAQFASKGEVLLNLLNKAKTKDSYKWWDKSIEIIPGFSKSSTTINVETTAYGLLALLTAQQDSQCLPILRWLLNQRNNQGGFEGTQDTVIGIEALAAFAAKCAVKDSEIKISAKSVEDKIEKNFVVNKENSLILQSERLSANTRTVEVIASGHGLALAEVSYRYNINDSDPVPAFKLKTKAILKTSEHIDLQISTCYQPPNNANKEKRSNMAVLEISFPSGFIVNTDALDDLKSKVGLIKKVETKDGNTVAVIYFDHLTQDLVTFNLDGFRQFVVSDQKPSSIVVYDYYDNAFSAREFYSPGSEPEPAPVPEPEPVSVPEPEFEQHPNGEPMEISPQHEIARAASPSKIPKAVKASKIPRKMDTSAKVSHENHHKK